MIPQTLIKQEIDDVEFEVIIAPNVKVCNLLINREDLFISDVDLAQVIRAIINSDDLYEVREALQGIWRDEVATAMMNNLIDGDVQ